MTKHSKWLRHSSSKRWCLLLFPLSLSNNQRIRGAPAELAGAPKNSKIEVIESLCKKIPCFFSQNSHYIVCLFQPVRIHAAFFIRNSVKSKLIMFPIFSKNFIVFVSWLKKNYGFLNKVICSKIMRTKNVNRDKVKKNW